MAHRLHGQFADKVVVTGSVQADRRRLPDVDRRLMIHRDQRCYTRVRPVVRVIANSAPSSLTLHVRF